MRDETGATRPARPRPWLRIVLLGVALSLAALFLHDKLPRPGDVAAAVREANPWWLLAGLAAEWVSIAMFARQQMWLLRGLGVSTTIGQALAATYSRSAMSISMPAGTAVSAGFAFQTYRRWGASRESAGAVMVLSALASFIGFGLLYLLGFLVVLAGDPTGTWRRHPVGTVLGVAVAAAIATGYALSSRWPVLRADRAGTRAVLAGTPVEPTGNAVRRALGYLREVAATAARMPMRYRQAALAFAVVNWLTDLCCLAAVANAFHLPLTFVQLATVYLAVQVVRQIPVTPGGIGVIEASLLAALVTAGAGRAPAAAAVLGYRLFSCWLIIPAGLLCWTVISRHESTGVAAAVDEPLEPPDTDQPWRPDTSG